MSMLADKMLHLFGGRMDAWGQDWVDLEGDVRGRAVHGPVTADLINDHLEGRQGVGIYPMWYQNEKWWVKWGCCDIDTGDWNEAYGLAVALRSMGFTPFIERSRSKGWHVWVFADGPVEAYKMRRALKVAYAACDLQAREANPKAEELRPDQLGNYVRLPYKGGKNGCLERQTFMTDWNADNDGTPIGVGTWFGEFDSTMRAHPGTIDYWAGKWKEPKRKKFNRPSISEDRLKELFAGINQDLFDFIKDGPKGSGDRSEALVALAFKMRRGGYTPEETYAAVEAADQRWGKYHLRPDGDVYLLDIVERTM